MEGLIKQLKREIKTTVMKIEDSSERELALNKIIKKTVKDAGYDAETKKKTVLLLKKKAQIIMKKMEKLQTAKETEKEVEKENKKDKTVKKTENTVPTEKSKKKNKEKSKTTKEGSGDKVTNLILKKFITGQENEKFFKDNKLTQERVEEFVTAMKALNESDESAKLRLFSDREDIFMMITCFKIPKTPSRQLRFFMPNPLVSQGDNVLLFVTDVTKGRKNVDKSEEHFKTVLANHNVTIVSEVMCFTRVKMEYDQYELKRKLLNSYETFLVDGRIAGHMAHFLGKMFTQKRKLPVPIKMDAKDINKEIQRGLRRTNMQMHSTGDTYMLRIGTTNMSTEHIAQNFRAVCVQLDKEFPGGWSNIRALRIKTPLGKALPIYVSLKNKNKVDIPVVSSKRPKAYKDVEGELTTLSYHDKVVVTPEGSVSIIPIKKRKVEENGESKELNDDEPSGEKEESESEEDSSDED